MEKKLRDKETAYQERLRNWEVRERKRRHDFKEESRGEKERKAEMAKEARRLKEFLEDYDDLRDDPKYYKGSALARRMKARDGEAAEDNRDRQKEKEEMEELKAKLKEEGHGDDSVEIIRLDENLSSHLRPMLHLAATAGAAAVAAAAGGGDDDVEDDDEDKGQERLASEERLIISEDNGDAAASASAASASAASAADAAAGKASKRRPDYSDDAFPSKRRHDSASQEEDAASRRRRSSHGGATAAPAPASSPPPSSKRLEEAMPAAPTVEQQQQQQQQQPPQQQHALQQLPPMHNRDRSSSPEASPGGGYDDGGDSPPPPSQEDRESSPPPPHQNGHHAHRGRGRGHQDDQNAVWDSQVKPGKPPKSSSEDESRPLGFQGIRLGGGEGKGKVEAKRKKLKPNEAFAEEEESSGGEAANPTTKKPRVENAAVASNKPLTADEKKKAIKQLIERIPTAKEELFGFSLEWAMVDSTLMEKRIKPWINKKIIEYIGEEEQSLVEYICQKVVARSTPRTILEDVQMVLDDEAEVFVVKMWRLLVYETEAKKLGLVKY